MRCGVGLAAGLACLPAACTSSNYATTTGARAATTGRPSTLGAAAAAAGATGGGGTSGSSTSGGTSGTTGESCGPAWITSWNNGGDLPTDCPASQVELKGRLSDACLGTPIQSTEANLAGVDFYGHSLTATIEPCGVYYFCVDAGTPVTPLFTAAGHYLPTLVPTLDLSQTASPYSGVAGQNGFNIFCTQVLDSLMTAVNPPPQLQLALVEVVVGNSEETQAPLCSSTAFVSGWSFDLLTADGTVVDAGLAYLDGVLPIQSDAGTGGSGTELLYNIDPALSPVTVVGHHPGNDLPDGGVLCPDESTVPPLMYTGEIPLSGGTLTYVLYQRP